jgi:hypothetical protein
MPVGAGRTGRAGNGGVGHPQRRRIGTARLADARLWSGVGLVVAATVAGVLVVGAGNDTVTVLRAGHDLSVGTAPSGLVPVAISRSAAGEAYVSGDLPAGSVLRWPVRAGDLLPKSAIAAPGSTPRRQVTVPVDPLHAPIGLLAGDHVDVWVSPRQPAPDGPRPRLVVGNTTVVSAQSDQVGLGGEIAVILSVAEGEVVEIVAAARAGVLDLVLVPLDAQQPTETGGSLTASGT